MTLYNRRALLSGAAATFALSACGNGVGSEGGAKIDARADAALYAGKRAGRGTVERAE